MASGYPAFPMKISGVTFGSSQVARAYGVSPARPAMPAGANSLVAARIDARLDFSPAGASPTPSPAQAGAFRMYTRSADVNEVATGVAIGRSVDLTA